MAIPGQCILDLIEIDAMLSAYLEIGCILVTAHVLTLFAQL